MRFRRRCLEIGASGLGDEPATQEVMKDVWALYALSKIEADMGYLLTEGDLELNAGLARAVAVEPAAALCRKLGDVDTAIGLTDFGIPDHIHHAPIAQDWVAYNSFENVGELTDKAWRVNDSKIDNMCSVLFMGQIDRESRWGLR